MAYKILPEQPKPSSLNVESVHRLPAQALKGAATSTVGLPGDVLSLPYSGINKLVSSLGGENVPYEQSFLGKALPTSQTLSQGVERDVPYLKPKNKIEQFVGDVVGDATSLFIPGKAITKAGLRGTSAIKSFATSLGANSAGDFVSDLTGDPQKGAYTKMGTMFLLSAMNKPKVQKEIGELYKKADGLLPKDAVVSAQNLEKDLTGLQKKVLQGRGVQDLAPSEKFVIDEADKILRQIDLGEVNVNTLKAGLRSLNENLLKAVYEAPDKSTRTRARSLATQINRSVNGTLAEYGKSNPEWYKAHKGASDAFGALAQSNFLSNYIKNNLKDVPVSPHLLHALGIAGTAATGVVPYQSAKILYRISKSPELAKHYARVVSSASLENASLMRKEMKKLDDELKKEESKGSRYKLLD
jgi:hypothetical protein